MQTLASLKDHPLFRDLTEEDFSHACTFLQASFKTYKRGEFLIRAGEAFRFFGIVAKGSIQVYTDDIDGNCMMMANVGANESFGESLAYFLTEESPVYAVAFEDAEVIWLSAAALRQAYADEKAAPVAALLKERFTALLAARALSQNDRIQILSKPTIRERLIAFFTQWEHRTKSRTFRVPFDRSSLAVYLGVNRSALSRELSAMKKEGVIDFFRSSFRLLK